MPRVHRVAHRTKWTSLRVLSLYRLTQLLANFTITEDRTGDILSFFKICLRGERTDERYSEAAV